MLRVAWFAPLKDQESLGAYTTRILLPHLKNKCDITLFDLESGEFLGQHVKNFLSAFREHREQPFDLFFYQLEDRRSAYFVRTHLS